MIYWLDLFGTLVFAITGSLVAGKKEMDLFGVIVVATVTSIGGGTIRDIIAGNLPVFWVHDTLYIMVCLVGALGTFVIARYTKIPEKFFLVPDALGLAVFTVIGVSKGVSQDFPGSVAIIMGIMTGTFGGMVRDMLCDQVPLVLKKEIYATASFCGALTFVLLSNFSLPANLITFTSITVTLVMRLIAIRLQIALPVFTQVENK